MKLSPLLAATSLVVASTAAGQSVPTRTLTKPTAVLTAVDFNDISRVAELPGGKVVLIDGNDGTVHLADLAANTVSQLGRKGAGPKEFGRPSGLLWKADTLLIDDASNGRFAMVTSDGTLLDRTLPKNLRAVNTPVRGVDARGRLYLLPPFAGKDSVPITRFDIATGKLDSLVNVASGWAGGGNRRKDGAGVSVGIRVTTYPEADYFGVHDDGTIMIARIGDYRVEAIAPDGRRTTSAPVPYEKVKIPAAEQGRAGGLTIKPPFHAGSGTRPLTSPNGWFWVRKTTANDRDYHYDIFDRNAKRIGTVVMPQATRVLAFGKSAIYAARSDADDLQQLQAFPLPSLR